MATQSEKLDQILGVLGNVTARIDALEQGAVDTPAPAKRKGKAKPKHVKRGTGDGKALATLDELVLDLEALGYRFSGEKGLEYISINTGPEVGDYWFRIGRRLTAKTK